MFMMNHLVGFGVGSSLVETLFDRTTGTNIGDMTAGGNLAAAFDGNANQIHTAGAKKDSTQSGFVGKTLPTPRPISKLVVTPSSNFGFWSSAANAVLTAYVKDGTAPSGPTDGTPIGTTGSFADGVSAKTIESNDKSTARDHVWVTVSNGDPADSACVAEVEIYIMA